MSGALTATVRGGGASRITVGTSGTQAGFVSGSFGSASNQRVNVPYSTGTLLVCDSAPTYNLRLWIAYDGSAALVAGSLKKVAVENGSGTLTVLDTSSATFTTGFDLSLGFYGEWKWGDGSARVWATTDSAEVHPITFIA